MFFARFKVEQENANVPLRASDLPWWNWLLIAAIAAFVSGFIFVVGREGNVGQIEPRIE